MDTLRELWIPLRLTGLAAWALSCVVAVVALRRSGAAGRQNVWRLAATYLILGGLSMFITAFAVGQHYSYTDVVMNGVPMGFDLDFFVRHAGIATISALLLCRRTSFSISARRWWTVGGAAVGELLVRADNTALLVLLEPDQREVGLAGALVPPIVGAIGAVVASGRVDAVVAERLSRGA